MIAFLLAVHSLIYFSQRFVKGNKGSCPSPSAPCANYECQLRKWREMVSERFTMAQMLQNKNLLPVPGFVNEICSKISSFFASVVILSVIKFTVIMSEINVKFRKCVCC